MATDPFGHQALARKPSDMRSHALYWPALLVASVAGAILAISASFELARAVLVRPATIVTAGVAFVLFLRMLFDPQCHRGIDAANKEIQGDQPFRFRWIRPLDPQWGLFGSRTGMRSLQAVRAVILFEFITTLFLAGKNETDLLLLAVSAFAVVIMLSVIHAGLNTQVRHS